MKKLQMGSALKKYRQSGAHLNAELTEILDDIAAHLQASEERWRHEYVRNISSAGDATGREVSSFNRAELLANLLYPKHKFSEFGVGWLDDAQFRAIYERTMDPGNWHAYDRAYTMNQLLKSTRHLSGDYAKMGVYKGGSAHHLCAEAKITSARVLLYDSFEGLSAPGEGDGEYWTAGNLSIGTETVATNLADFDNFELCKGWIPNCFDGHGDELYRFVHIDVDLAQPTLDSIVHAYDRLVPGGIIVMDDYGFASCPGARQVADEFFADRPEEIINLTVGSAFVVRR